MTFRARSASDRRPRRDESQVRGAGATCSMYLVVLSQADVSSHRRRPSDPAEAFVKGAPASGATTLGAELPELLRLEAAHGRDALVAALERAVQFGRWRVGDVRSIIEAGRGVPGPGRPGEALIVPLLPQAATRSLADYAPEGLS